jgi:membrane-bound lytic murein transglycosylase D
MTIAWRQYGSGCAISIVTMLLAACQTTGATHGSTATNTPQSVSQPTPLPPSPPVVASELPPELSTPITAPSSAPLPPEGDTMTSGQVLDRLRARLSTPTCIKGPNNTRWRERYAGYPDHFAEQVQAILPMMLVVLDELEHRKLPGEFALIPIVESWYRPDAHGFGGPAGMWQMIAQTARNNGATVISGYDGRLSPLDSTRAALNYLEKVHAIFGDWRLTAMGYNSGEYRVIRAMPHDEVQGRSAGGQFGYHRPDGLSTTTYEYVAKLRALTCLLAHPELRSIPLPDSVAVTHWVPFELPSGITSLGELAQRLGVDANELKAYNQGYRNGRIVAGAPRTLLVPASSKPRWAGLTDSSTVATVATNLPDPVATPAPQPADPKPSGSSETSDKAPTHVVLKGESLDSIAQLCQVPVEKLRRWNRLGRKPALKPGQVLKLER